MGQRLRENRATISEKRLSLAWARLEQQRINADNLAEAYATLIRDKQNCSNDQSCGKRTWKPPEA